jgi:uroporphyrinogen-III synthase
VSPARPLEGRRVLVTRPASQAAPLAQHLRHLGASVMEVPAIALQPVAGAPEMRGAARRIRDRPPPRWMALTSANAVNRLADLVLPDDVAGVRAAAVGEVTARVMRAMGIHVDLVGSGSGAEDLGRRLVAAGAGRGSVWLPQAEGATPALAELLRRAGAAVEVTVCYRTIPVAGLADALGTALAGGVDAVTLLSPSAVDAVLAAVGATALTGPVLVCGGATTAEAVRIRGLRPVVAARSDPEAVAAALLAALGGSPAPAPD